MLMSDRFLIYGANGYTGSLIAEEAARVGLRPVLAGRTAEKLAPLARRLGFAWMDFDLSNEAALRRSIAGMRVVLHAAGPYSRTGQPMVNACMAEGVHYIDICGEIAVLEALSKRDADARRKDVMLLAGAGFDVVPSDCLLAHLRRRLPSANAARLFIGGTPVLSRGTTRTLAESIASGTIVRREGNLVELDHPPRDFCDFGNGLRPVIGVSLGDVVTGWWSTQLPNIAVYFEVSPALEQLAGTPRFLRHLLSTQLGQWTLNRLIDRQPIGPSADERNARKSILVGEAADSAGSIVRSRLSGPESYGLSATTAIEIARRALLGEFRAGYQTPSTVYGADLITSIAGVVREDLA
jgi:short subunit dehydrogenase-like uncharacterized protein